LGDNGGAQSFGPNLAKFRDRINKNTGDVKRGGRRPEKLKQPMIGEEAQKTASGHVTRARGTSNGESSQSKKPGKQKKFLRSTEEQPPRAQLKRHRFPKTGEARHRKVKRPHVFFSRATAS